MKRFDNAFKYLDTFGLPLSFIMAYCHQNGFSVNFSSFWMDAASAGWSKEKTLNVINEAVGDLRSEHVSFYAQS